MENDSNLQEGLPNTAAFTPVVRSKKDSRLTKDLETAQRAIDACDSALTNPFFANIREGVLEERLRLYRMLTDWKMLWNVYRRADKKPPYYVEAEEKKIAA